VVGVWLNHSFPRAAWECILGALRPELQANHGFSQAQAMR
jgi:hypothetical protein